MNDAPGAAKASESQLMSESEHTAPEYASGLTHTLEPSQQIDDLADAGRATARQWQPAPRSIRSMALEERLSRSSGVLTAVCHQEAGDAPAASSASANLVRHRRLVE